MTEKKQPAGSTQTLKASEEALHDVALDQVNGGTLTGAAQTIGNVGVMSTVTTTVQQKQQDMVNAVVNNIR